MNDAHATLVEGLTLLCHALSEKRDDIASVIEGLMDGKPIKELLPDIEHRFVTCDVPKGATRVTYDTHTTTLEFQISAWVQGENHTYSDTSP